MKNLLTNIDYQIARIEETGIEVKPILFSHRSKKIRHFYSVNPLDRMRQKGTIGNSEYISAKQYQHDFELANQTHHARMSYDSILTDGGKSVAFELEEKHIRAAENVCLIKKLIEDKEKAYQKYCEARGGRKRQAGYLRILELLVEKQMMIAAVRVAIGFHPETKNILEKRLKVVIQIIDNYYSN